MQRAIKYTQNLWPGLILFLDDARIPLDTNHVERGVRALAPGCKNHYGSRSPSTSSLTLRKLSRRAAADTCNSRAVAAYEIEVAASTKRSLRRVPKRDLSRIRIISVFPG